MSSALGTVGSKTSGSDATKSPNRLLTAPHLVIRVIQLALLAAFIGGWQLISWKLIAPAWISSPTLVAQRLWSMLQDGSLVHDTWITFQEAVFGLVIGVVLGLGTAIGLHFSGRFAKTLDPFLKAAYSLPRVALAPFYVLWVGIGLFSKVLLVVSIVYFVALFNVEEGLRSIDPDLLDALRSMRAGRLLVLRWVIMPSLLTWLASAVRIGLGLALTAAVVGEMLGAQTGLGWYINNSIQQFDMTGAVAALVALVIVAMVLYYAMELVERRVFRWRAPAGSASNGQF